MAKHNHPNNPFPNPLPDPDDVPMDLSESELAELAKADVPPLTAPMDPSRDDDYIDQRAGAVETPSVNPIQLRMEETLRKMNERLEDSSGGGSNSQIAAAMVMLAEAIAGMKSGQLESAQVIADAQKATMRPQNENPPLISVFNPRGDKDFPRPSLKCPMFIPWPVEPEAQTREELELLNLLEPGDTFIRMVDNRKVKMIVHAELKMDSMQPSKITIEHPTAFNQENHRSMPYDWIRQLVLNNPSTRDRAKLVLTMEEEETLILAKRFNDGRQATARERVVSIGA